MGDRRRPGLAPRAERLAVLALALGLLLPGLAGCKLFEPAKPETPDTGVPVIIPDYSTIESCLHYMKVGIEAKAYGQAAYIGALADTTKFGVGFHATFDPEVWNSFTGSKPADWNLDLETQFFGVLIAKYPGAYTMEWNEDVNHIDETNPEQTRAIWHRQYKIRTDLGSGETALIAVGYADLYFSRIGTRWVLTRWDDRVDPAVGFPPADDRQQTLGQRRLNFGAGG